MPKRHILQLEDSYAVSRFQQAIEAAVKVGGKAGSPQGTVATGFARHPPLPAGSEPPGCKLDSDAAWAPVPYASVVTNAQHRCQRACAVSQAVAAEDKDCRVLNLGAGAGLHAMLALRAGAHHVTAVERWLYLALACKECMLANEVRQRGLGRARMIPQGAE